MSAFSVFVLEPDRLQTAPQRSFVQSAANGRWPPSLDIPVWPRCDTSIGYVSQGGSHLRQYRKWFQSLGHFNSDPYQRTEIHLSPTSDSILIALGIGAQNDDQPPLRTP